MWTEMKRLNDVLAAAMHDHEALCRQPRPDVPAIARARWRIAEASRRRLEFLTEDVLPYAEEHAVGEVARRLQAVKDRTAGYRQRVSAFLGDWPTEKIPDHWAEYQAAAFRMRCTVRARLADEAAAIRLIALSDPTASPAQLVRQY